MIIVVSKKLVVIALIASSLSASICAMQHDDETAPKRTLSRSIQEYTQSFFNGWGPTLTFFASTSLYCTRYDRQAPLKAAVWIKTSFVETPKLVAYPAALVGICCAYTYYKPRFEDLLQRIKDRRLW